MLKDFKLKKYKDFFQEADPIQTSPDDNGESFYGYIPAYWIEFEDILKDIDLPKNPKVLDIGVGYGYNLLYLGSVIDSRDLHGIEINDKYNSDMNNLINKYSLPITIYEGGYDEYDISSYDVIYSFCIAKKQPEYSQVNQFILNNMKKGAIRIEALSKNPNGNGSVIEDIENNEGNFDILYNDMIIIVKKSLEM